MNQKVMTSNRKENVKRYFKSIISLELYDEKDSYTFMQAPSCNYDRLFLSL